LVKAFFGFRGAPQLWSCTDSYGAEAGFTKPLFVIFRAVYNLTSKPALPPSVYAVAKRCDPWTTEDTRRQPF